MPRGALIGTRIRERRLALDLKQTDLAAAAGISASYLNLIEHNRRRIGGRVLIDLAAALRMDVGALSGRLQESLVRSLETAGAAAEETPEVDSIEELIGRFPGWARLIADLTARREQLENLVDNLSDRMTHDPFLSESLHAILSSVTAIQATSGILMQAEGMERLQTRRFQSNIHDESERLSDASRALVGYLDRQSEGERTLATPLDEVDAFLAANGYHFPALEIGREIESVLATGTDLSSDAGRDLAGRVLEGYAADARAMPLERILDAGRAVAWRTDALAAEFGVDRHAVYRRLAFLPRDAGRPEFGLIGCDGAGAVLIRRPLAGFDMPRYGPGCALWPLYQALTRPHAPLTAVLTVPDGQSFRAEAVAIYGREAAPGVAAVHSAMLLRREAARDGAAAVETGQACRVCPRDGCVARRETSIRL